MEDSPEIWKPVVNYEGLYEVSNMGRVKALEKIRVVGRDKGFRVYPEIIMNGTPTPQGYLRLKLCNHGKYRRVSIHLIVVHAFWGYVPTDPKIVVDHKDNDPSNNKLSNLQIITSRENITKDRIRGYSEYPGIFPKGKRWGSQITVDGNNIWLGIFDTEEEASEYYQNAISAIYNGEEIKTAPRKYTSEYEGVSWNKKDKRWTAWYKKKYYGCFKSEIEAHHRILEIKKELGY